MRVGNCELDLPRAVAKCAAEREESLVIVLEALCLMHESVVQLDAVQVDFV